MIDRFSTRRGRLDHAFLATKKFEDRLLFG
jgi:hypothetical protein